MGGKSYEYETLWKKYNNFEKPSFSVVIDSEKLLDYKGIGINELEITTTCMLESNMAVIVLSGMENEKDLKEVINKLLKIGNKVEIKAGYQDKNELIFYGYLHHFSIQEEEYDYNLIIELICLDVKGLMMSCSSYEFDPAKKISQILNDVIGNKIYKKFYIENEIKDPETSINLTRIIKNETDYELICNLADYFGYEFYVSEKKIYFTKARNDTSSLVKLSKGKGIRKFFMEVNLSGQISKVSTCGISPKGEKLNATESRSQKKRTGDQKLSELLNKDGRYYLNTTADNKEALQYMAKKYMQQSESQYGGFHALCIGLPELMPGRFITIESDTKEISGKYYVKTVRHVIRPEGYFTELEGEME